MSRSNGHVGSDAIVGCLLGTAAGDALGLPYEGLSPRRAGRLFGAPSRHRILWRWGMVSDDTEHAILVAQALCVSGGVPRPFARALAWRLRFWLLGLPGGIGLATLRAILRLWIGFRPEKSGVFSAGNGPAMRAPILGVAAPDIESMVALIEASTRITHTDPKALDGALAVALAARMAAQGSQVVGREYLATLGELPLRSDELPALVRQVVESVERGESTRDFAISIGLDRGVSGYVLHTVPVCLHAWLTSPDDFASAVQSIILCGGDADTTAAIVGGIVGTRVTRDGIPAAWLERLIEWPLGVASIEKVGVAVDRTLRDSGGDAAAPDEHGQPAASLPRAARMRWPVVSRLPRNALFLVVVLLHGFRRLLPPY